MLVVDSSILIAILLAEPNAENYALHAARLNFGDCCSYAVAKSLQIPLLFQGNDFSQTDLLSA